MKIQFDSGVMMPDPADKHRYLLMVYVEKEDTMYVLRRCELVDTVIVSDSEAAKKGDES